MLAIFFNLVHNDSQHALKCQWCFLISPCPPPPKKKITFDHFLGTLTMCARKREGMSIKTIYMRQHQWSRGKVGKAWSLSSGALWTLPGETNAKVVGEIPRCFVFRKFCFLGCFCEILSCFLADDEVFFGQPGDGKRMVKGIICANRPCLNRDFGLRKD